MGWDAFEAGNTKTASKCYKITDQDCGAFPDYAGDENESGVDWNCDDGVNGGSKCNKRCIGYYSYQVASWNSPKTETECFCKGTCKWLLKTTECKAKLCPLPDWYPVQPGNCYDAAGEAFDIAHQNPIGYPEGSYCRNECAIGFDHEIWQADTSFCECDESGCKFDNKKINQCIQASCSPDIADLKFYFAEGISGKFVNIHDVSDVSSIKPSVNHFEQLDCPADGFWRETGSSNVDGHLNPYARLNAQTDSILSVMSRQLNAIKLLITTLITLRSPPPSQSMATVTAVGGTPVNNSPFVYPTVTRGVSKKRETRLSKAF